MIKYLKIILLLILSIIFFPNKKILIFGDRRGFRFADNSRYLFLLLQKNSEFRCIWVTKNDAILKDLRGNNLECYKVVSFKGFYYSLKAKWHIFNHSSKDTSENLSLFRNKLNLWHSTPLKKLKKFENNNIIYKYLFKLRNFFIKEYILLGNNNYSLHLMSQFHPNRYKKIIANLPRNIILNKDTKKYDYLRSDYEKNVIRKLDNLNKKIIGYFPTFREKSKDMFIDINSNKELLNLNNTLEKNNSIILFKRHQNSFKEDKSTSYDLENEKINSELMKLSNFIALEYECDLNSILSKCDVLITDYAGVVFDYLFLDKPAILYCPDLELYKKHPGIALELEKQNFAYLAKDKFQLYKLLEEYFTDEKKFKQFHELSRKDMLEYMYPNKNFLNEIKQLLNT